MRLKRPGVFGMALLVLFVGAGEPDRSRDLGDGRAAPAMPGMPFAEGPARPGTEQNAEQSSSLKMQPGFEVEDPEAEALEELPRDPHASPVELDRLSVEPARSWQRGPFRSIQVNVDAAGGNIRGDAANEPSIAINPREPGQIVVGWRQFDSINSDFREAGYSTSSDGGATWSAKRVLEEGVFRSDPVLGADLDGNFYYFSLTVSPANVYHADLFQSRDGGSTWLPRVDARGGDKEWMAIDTTDGVGRGNLYETWNGFFSCCGGFTDFARSVDGGASFEPPLAIDNPKMRWGTLDVGPDGTLYLAGVFNTIRLTPGHVFARSPNAARRDESPAFDRLQMLSLGGPTTMGGGVNPGGLAGQVWIATDHSRTSRRGNVYLVATINRPDADEGNLDVVFIRSEDGGLSWSQPLRVHHDPIDSGTHQWFGTLSVAPNGRIDVIWNDTRNDPGNLISEVFYTFSSDGGVTWSPELPVTPPFNPTLGYPHNGKIGDYYQMISDNGGASLAYAATFNGEQDVYFLRIPFDCNGNGVEDDCEISCAAPGKRCEVAGCGSGSDRDDNGVLDACENRAPVAEAGPDQTVECAFPGGAAVVLDGSASSDPDGDPLSYIWMDDTGAILGMGETAAVSLPLGSHLIELTVEDGKGGVSRDRVTVLIRDTTPPVVQCLPAGSLGTGASRSGAFPAPEAGFYTLVATDVCSTDSLIFVSDANASGPFGPFRSGVQLKITETPGGKAGIVSMGNPSAGPWNVGARLHLSSDPAITGVDASMNSTRIRCLLPPPPK